MWWQLRVLKQGFGLHMGFCACACSCTYSRVPVIVTSLRPESYGCDPSHLILSPPVPLPHDEGVIGLLLLLAAALLGLRWHWRRRAAADGSSGGGGKAHAAALLSGSNPSGGGPQGADLEGGSVRGLDPSGRGMLAPQLSGRCSIGEPPLPSFGRDGLHLGEAAALLEAGERCARLGVQVWKPKSSVQTCRPTKDGCNTRLQACFCMPWLANNTATPCQPTMVTAVRVCRGAAGCRQLWACVQGALAWA